MLIGRVDDGVRADALERDVEQRQRDDAMATPPMRRGSCARHADAHHDVGLDAQAPSIAVNGLMPKSRWSRRTSALQPRRRRSRRTTARASAVQRQRAVDARALAVAHDARRAKLDRGKAARASTSSAALRSILRASRRDVAGGAQRRGVEAAEDRRRVGVTGDLDGEALDAQTQVVSDGGEEPFAKCVDEAVGGRRVVEHARTLSHRQVLLGQAVELHDGAARALGRVLDVGAGARRAPSASSRRRTPGR